MKAIVQDLQRLENMTPILALVVQSLVQHFHNLEEIRWAAGEIGSVWASPTPKKRKEKKRKNGIIAARAYLPNVKAAISAISVPVGPQGSLLVAGIG